MCTLSAGMVDVIFADVAQPDQARIVSINAQHFLKNQGHFVISIKVGEGKRERRRRGGEEEERGTKILSLLDFMFTFHVLSFVSIIKKNDPSLHCHSTYTCITFVCLVYWCVHYINFPSYYSIPCM